MGRDVDRDLVRAEDPKTIKANRENYIKRVSGDRFSMAVARGDKRAMAVAFILGEDPKGRSRLERARLWFGGKDRPSLEFGRMFGKPWFGGRCSAGLEFGKLWSGGSKDMFKGMGMDKADSNWGVEVPVIEAARHGRFNLAKFLCEGGLDPWVKSSGKNGIPQGLSALSVAAYYNQADFFSVFKLRRNFDMSLEVLFTEKVGDKTVYQHLQDRAGGGEEIDESTRSSAKAILENLALVTYGPLRSKRSADLALAVREGDIHEIRLVVSDRHLVSIDGKGFDRVYDKPLFEAAKHGQVESAQALLELGANEYLTSSKVPGLSLISQAALHGQPEFFNFMLERGADPKVLLTQEVDGKSVYQRIQERSSGSSDEGEMWKLVESAVKSAAKGKVVPIRSGVTSGKGVDGVSESPVLGG